MDGEPPLRFVPGTLTGKDFVRQEEPTCDKYKLDLILSE